MSAVVTTYSETRWECLTRTVTSLRTQTLEPLEVIVVVDHNPELLDRVRSEWAEVVSVENTNLRGLSGARNAGLAVARGDVVAFIDDDAEAHPDWLAVLLSAYADPSVVGAGGAIEPVWDAGRPDWFPVELDWVVGCTYVGLPATTTPVRNLIGCNMSFRRESAVEVGGFRRGIGRIGSTPLGCEETEFCIRIRQRRFGLLLYEPRARVRHSVPSSRSQWPYFLRRCYAEGVSKARVASAVGSRDGLSSERAYVVRTLPRAVGRGLADFGLGRRPGGLRRTAAVVAGLVTTTLGFAWGRVQRQRDPSSTAAALDQTLLRSGSVTAAHTVVAIPSGEPSQ